MRDRIPLLILAAAFGGCTPPAAVSPASSASLPSTPLQMLDGQATDLASVTHGHPAVISLWATWCDSCLIEIDALRRLDAELSVAGDGMVVGVAVGEQRERVATFARSRHLAYARWVDQDFQVADALGERRIPATLVVDREGRIVYRGGALDAPALAAFRRALAAGPAAESLARE
jgi:thiol-disulfide isomerase/thioredoxin